MAHRHPWLAWPGPNKTNTSALATSSTQVGTGSSEVTGCLPANNTKKHKLLNTHFGKLHSDKALLWHAFAPCALPCPAPSLPTLLALCTPWPAIASRAATLETVHRGSELLGSRKTMLQGDSKDPGSVRLGCSALGHAINHSHRPRNMELAGLRLQRFLQQAIPRKRQA